MVSIFVKYEELLKAGIVSSKSCCKALNEMGNQEVEHQPSWDLLAGEIMTGNTQFISTYFLVIY